MATPGSWRLPLTLVLASGLALAAGSFADTLFVSSSPFTPTGTITRIDLATGATTVIVTGLDQAEGGACGPDGSIYFVETGLFKAKQAITRYSRDGRVLANVIPGAGQPGSPEGPTLDDAGNLYFNTRMNQSTAGPANGAWMVPGADPANPAQQIVAPFSRHGEGANVVRGGPHRGALLLVAAFEQEVRISEPPGAPLRTLIAPASFPTGSELIGVTTDGCGEVFVSFARLIGSQSGVYRFDPEGAFLEVYGTGFSDHPFFLDFDSCGYLYVADYDADVVRRVAPDGTTEVIASIVAPVGIAVCRDRPLACPLPSPSPRSARCPTSAGSH